MQQRVFFEGGPASACIQINHPSTRSLQQPVLSTGSRTLHWFKNVGKADMPWDRVDALLAIHLLCGICGLPRAPCSSLCYNPVPEKCQAQVGKQLTGCVPSYWDGIPLDGKPEGPATYLSCWANHTEPTTGGPIWQIQPCCFVAIDGYAVRWYILKRHGFNSRVMTIWQVPLSFVQSCW
jgi:hypothetical protein